MLRLMIFPVFWIILSSYLAIAQDCVNMWDAQLSDTNICPVQTKSGFMCQIPFEDNSYNKMKNYHCITYRSYPPKPQCITVNNEWSDCIVPTDAFIDHVVTNRFTWDRSAGHNGGTLVWISGYNFAQPLFTTSPTSTTSNQVILIGKFASYTCEIHPDKCTTTQITCFTPPMPEGSFTVKVMVNGYFIPYYQTNQWSTQIQISYWNTPQISSIQPDSSLPESFVKLNGDFKTQCLTMSNTINADNSSCAVQSNAIINRVYFGGQICELFDPNTNALYYNLTQYSMECKINRPEINYYNASILVSNQYGRSMVRADYFYVAPNDTLYNYQTYAQVNSISPQTGSIAGGTFVTLAGLYFYSDINVPAEIEIGGQPCNLVDFDMTYLPYTTFTCQSTASFASPASGEYYGNRGINLIIDKGVNTPFVNLSTANPTANAILNVTNKFSFNDPQSESVTIWLKGFLSPQKDSLYSFNIQVNGQAVLYLSTDASSTNKVLIASSQNTSSVKIQLAANQKYFIMAVASISSGSLNFQANAKMYQTTISNNLANSRVSSYVFNEQQQIEISSTIIPETYNISYVNNGSNGAGQSEIQELEISGLIGTNFVLQFKGVSTATLQFGVTADTIQKALNDIPLLSPNLVSVILNYSNVNESITTQSYTVVFCSDLGDVSNIEEVNGLVNSNVNEITSGIPSGKRVQLLIDSVATNLFDYTNTSDTQLALDQSFGTRCPYSILNGPDVVQSFDYEGCQYGSNMTSFCGKCSSLQTSNYFYMSVSQSINYFQYLCFAYKSNLVIDYIGISVYNNVINQWNWFGSNYNGSNDFEWHYDCLDLEAIFLQYNSTWKINYFYIYNSNGYYNLNIQMFFDAITLRNALPIGFSDNLLTTSRMHPLLEINSNSLQLTNYNNYKIISFQPGKCVSNLPLIKISQNISNINILRTKQASPSVTGTFSINWNNITIEDISADVSSAYLNVLLQNQDNFGSVVVTRSKDCYGYLWDLKWTSGGYKSPLLLNGSSLVGNNPTIKSKVIQEGYASFNPIRDDMLRTFHTVPQVTVSVNTITSKCNGSCDFQWSNSATPVVNTINSANLNSIIIDGTGFDSTIANNLVQIGGYNCTVSQATSQQLTVSASSSQIPFGTYSVTVNVIGKGLAQMNQNPSIQFQLTATSLSPSSSGTGGGINLNITGTGFNTNTTVAVDGSNCPVNYVDYTLIICQLPFNPTTTNKTVDVLVQQDSYTSTISQQFTYTYSNTPIVTSIIPNLLSVEGGQNITISGSNLPLNPQNVLIGNQTVSVLSSTGTSLIIQSIPMPPGNYSLIIPSDNGNAITNTLIEYQLYVYSFTPQISSIRGGSKVNINGLGFSLNCPLNQVYFDTQNCQILNCSNDWIQCETSSAYMVYNVNNSAADPWYGVGYAWSKPYLTINVGDSVYWSWRPPSGITTVTYQVIQVADQNSYASIGFNSGQATATGSFQYQFNQPGVYYYWSGYVENSDQITFRGVVVVQSSSDKMLTINVTTNGYRALQSQSSAQVTVDNTCSTSNLNYCNLTIPTSSYDMLFTKCDNNLPKILNVTNGNGAYNNDIVVEGTGFSANQCENEIWIGGLLCPLSSSSTTQLICQIPMNETQLQPNTNYQVDVLVKNIGYADYDSTFQIQFSPIITSITPDQGSINGGTQITISGYGFSQYAYVQIGSIPYYYFYNNDKNNTVITFNKIIINTIPIDNGQYQVYVNSNGMLVDCLNSCQFNASSDITPVIDSVSPSSLNSSGLVTLAGINFGNMVSTLYIIIGSQKCSVQSVSDQQVTCQLDGLDIGDQSINLNKQQVGNAIINSSQVIITGQSQIQSISPSSGSVNGGTLLTITGNGFDKNTTTIYIDGTSLCKIVSLTINQVTCLTSSHTSGTNLNFQISSKNTQFTTNSFLYEYSTALSPTITSLSPTSGSAGTLTISGSGFGTDSNACQVFIGNSLCPITSVTDTSVVCTLAPNGAGNFNVYVAIESKGYSNSQTFTYNLAVSSLSETQGSVGGGLSLVINGLGFTNNSQVTICGSSCKLMENSFTTLTCLVPSATNQASDSTCSVQVYENSLTATSTFTYSLSLTPRLASVSPLRGGTGGGTRLTIAGNNFPTDKTQVIVTIANTVCDIQTITASQIICDTNSYAFSSIKAPVQVFILNKGYALNNGSVQYQYIDLWSSQWTWGGLPPPGEGELAVISFGQTIYFDAVSTPKLKGIIIQGGSLIFDDNQDVSLNVEYIIIADKGTLQIGTKAQPFQHKATITMFGSIRSVELPIFGSKVIAVRNGTIDLHGAPVGVTWTYLNTTASAGTSTIKLNEPVIWPINSKIVIATTGNKFSVGQTETRIIISKLADNQTLTLDRPLQFEHLAEMRTVGTGSKQLNIFVRAEVGLLSRNVVFQGNNDDSWAPFLTAPACPSGFDPSPFAVQTCFLGRYGPELGTDQFGGTIMLSGDMRQSGQPESVIGRFSNVELFHVGQAYRLGRYPIHFHMNGDMQSSYVSECAIHESFNRATNIHASNYLTIDRNVIYDIMGGAYFLEDGVEIGNVYQYNLAIFVKPSSSSINEDMTPAAFWATNPNNFYLHNVVAGTSHFGFWFRMLDNPDGPSYNPNYRPFVMPLGRFYNNSVHSSGEFGLWVFPKFLPQNSQWDSTIKPAVFESFTSYSCDKGAEFDQSNNLQFKNFIVWDQYSVGIETQTIIQNQDINSQKKYTFYNNVTGAGVFDSIIIGNSLSNTQSLTPSGLVVAWDRGELISNVSFYNFPTSSSAAIRPTSIIGRCVFGCGGWKNKFQGLYFENVLYRTLHRWNWDFIAYDIDGTLTDQPGGGVVVASDGITSNNPACKSDNKFSNGVICPKNDWIRVTYTSNPPNDAIITDSLNHTAASFFSCIRLTAIGNMFALQTNQSYTIAHYSNPRLTTAIDISYSSVFYGLLPGEWLIIQHPLSGRKPDRVYLLNGQLSTESNNTLSVTTNNNGDWHWDNTTKTLSYILINNNNQQPFADYSVSYSAQFCLYPGCIIPDNNPNNIPTNNNNTINSRPANALFWCNETTWKLIGNNDSVLPVANDSVLIPAGAYVVVDCVLPPLKHLQIDGALEFDNGMNHYLEAYMIFINGGQMIIGFENDPILTNVTIVIKGDFETDTDTDLSDQFSLVKSKGIGVFGTLDIHGQPRNVVWTTLSETALSGSNIIKLNNPVDWKVNEEILIGSTSLSPSQSEVMIISAVSSDNMTITLAGPLLHDHLVFSETFSNGQSYKINAPVGLITRNVKLIGSEYPSQDSDFYGFKILVSGYSVLDTSSSTVKFNYYKGLARISNAQFIHMGQGPPSPNTCENGIEFKNLGNVTDYIINSSFNKGYGCILGIDSTIGIKFENNLLFHNYMPALVSGSGNVLRNNLFVSSSGSHPKFLGDAIIAENNFLVGVSFVYRGDICLNNQITNFNHSIKNNTIYAGNVIVNGIGLEYGIFSFDCLRISSFTVYKGSLGQFAAITYKGASQIVIDSNILIDNQLSIGAYVLQPASTSHIAGNKKTLIENNLIVGQSFSYNCAEDSLIQVGFNTFGLIGAGSNYNAKIGIMWSQFMDDFAGLWAPGWTAITNYNQIAGLTIVQNVTFAHFDLNCKGSYDAILATNYHNDDGQHPVTFANINFFNVSNESKVFIHRPNQNTVTVNQCGDMDCDGLKKELLTDLDGSFLSGTPGSTVIAQSEYEWGSQSRGLGDFRIPKEAVSLPNGSYISPIKLYGSNRGIIRDDSCVYRVNWQAYECQNLDFRMMIIESMDNDTEKRRISPVAVISDTGYIDLINGPQNHAWCSGFSCMKRVSTFMSLVASNHTFDVYLTATPPNQLRFRILNADSTFKLRLTMYYFTSQRIDLYMNDAFVNATNALYVNGKMTIQDPAANLNAFMPNLTSSPTGANLYYKGDNKMHFIIDGSTYIDLKIAPVLFVRFGVPAITPVQFFNEATLVGNFALLLGIDSSKIRRVNIVRAKSSGKKKRQSSDDDDTIYVELTIMNDPVTSLTNTNASNAINSQMTSISNTITNQYVSGQLQQRALSLNITLTAMSVIPPITTPSSSGNSSQPIVLATVAKLVVIQNADQCKSLLPCVIQPVIAAYDSNGNLMDTLQNWIVLATVSSSTDANARIIYQTNATVVNGYANFTNLGISSVTDQFVINYKFDVPTGIDSTYFNPLKMNAKAIASTKPQFTCFSLNTGITIQQNGLFNLTFSVVDSLTSLQIPNITWTAYTWQADVSMYKLGYYQAKGHLIVNQTVITFDTTTGYMSFSGLAIDNIGMYLLSVRVYTAGNEFTSQCYSNPITIVRSLTSLTNSSKPNYQLKYRGNFEELTPQNKSEIQANTFNFMSMNNITVNNIQIYSGSVYIAFFSADNNTQLINELAKRGLTISTLISFDSITVNGETFICLDCQLISDSNGINVGAIVGGTIGGVVFFIIVIWLVYFGYKQFKKIQINSTRITPDYWQNNGLPGQSSPTPSYSETLLRKPVADENIN